MRKVLHGLTALAVLAAASTAVAAGKPRLAPHAELAGMLAGRTAGAPVDCISQRAIESVKIIDKTAIVYRLPGGALYVNRPSGAEVLDRDAALISRTSGSQLCRMDILNLFDPGMSFSHGAVSLGAFTPYAKPRP